MFSSTNHPLLRKILYPVSIAYAAGAALDRSLTVPQKLSRPVISVGNLTWGGTGKTPTVVTLCRTLMASGRSPAVLTRGYGRRNARTASVVVRDRDRILSSCEDAGDEPYLLAGALPGSVVVSGPDRVASARLADEKYHPDVFVLDDGFQHWKIARDLDIVCINALDPFGNGCRIPAGSLREARPALKRAGMIVITNTDAAGEERTGKAESEVREQTQAPVLRAFYRPVAFERLHDRRRLSCEDWRGKEALVMSAIGENRGFIATLERCGIKAAGKLDFIDHHWYNNSDLAPLLSRFPKHFPIITTFKDAVKLYKVIANLPEEDALRFHALDIELTFARGGDVWETEIRKRLPSS